SGEQPAQPAARRTSAHPPHIKNPSPPLGEEAGDLAPMILQVASHDDGGMTGGELKACGSPGMAAIVTAQPNYLDPPIGAIEVDEDSECVAVAAILDKQDLPVD